MYYAILIAEFKNNEFETHKMPSEDALAKKLEDLEANENCIEVQVYRASELHRVVETWGRFKPDGTPC